MVNQFSYTINNIDEILAIKELKDYIIIDDGEYFCYSLNIDTVKIKKINLNEIKQIHGKINIYCSYSIYVEITRYRLTSVLISPAFVYNFVNLLIEDLKILSTPNRSRVFKLFSAPHNKVEFYKSIYNSLFPIINNLKSICYYEYTFSLPDGEYDCVNLDSQSVNVAKELEIIKSILNSILNEL